MFATGTASGVGGEEFSSAFGNSAASRYIARVLIGLCVVVTTGAVGFSVHQRYSLARDVSWQCDELPLLSRFTSVGGVATTEAEALAFQPSLYSLRTGLIRSLRVPPYLSSVHTTAQFWTSLTLNLFGYNMVAGRAMSLFFGCVAIIGVAWGTWLCVRNIPATCFASLVVAYSPALTAYSAQSRGYGEGISLVPLMLVAFELWRRKSSSWVRLAFLSILTIQLSLTVYTMWVYWVFPVLAMSMFVLPHLIPNALERASARAMLVGLFVVMCIWMGIFTAERWKTLTFASTYGLRFSSWGEFGLFFQLFFERLIPLPMVTVPLAVVGAFGVHRTRTGWWGGAVLSGVAIRLVCCVLNGSPGYMRNLFYVLGPLSILAAIGFCAIVRIVSCRCGEVGVGLVSVVAVVGISSSSSASLRGRAYEIILPDWGAVVQSVDAEAKTSGARFFCPCAANHWQINWYRDRSDDATIRSLSTGDHIEVVIGAQLTDAGDAVIFRHNKSLEGVRPEVLPGYLAQVSPSRIQAGVEVRRWRGTKVKLSALTNDGDPVLALVLLVKTPSMELWARFLRETGAYDAGVVVFKERYLEGGQLHSMVVPSHISGRVDRFVREEMGATGAAVSWIELSPLSVLSES